MYSSNVTWNDWHHQSMLHVNAWGSFLNAFGSSIVDRLFLSAIFRHPLSWCRCLSVAYSWRVLIRSPRRVKLLFLSSSSFFHSAAETNALHLALLCLVREQLGVAESSIRNSRPL